MQLNFLFIIFFTAVLISTGIVFLLYIFMKTTSCKSMKYVIIWILWFISVIFIFLSKVLYYSKYTLYIELLGFLFFNLAFMKLDHVYKCEFLTYNKVIFSYLLTTITNTVFIILTMLTEHIEIMISLTIFELIRNSMFSIIYKRYGFFIMDIFFIIYFSIISVLRSLHIDTKLYPQLWLLLIFATIFGIIGTYVNGGHSKTYECHNKCYNSYKKDPIG